MFLACTGLGNLLDFLDRAFTDARDLSQLFGVFPGGLSPIESEISDDLGGSSKGANSERIGFLNFKNVGDFTENSRQILILHQSRNRCSRSAASRSTS